MPEEIMTLRALYNSLAARPNQFRLHQFFERVVTMIEEQDREIIRLKNRVSVLDDPTARPEEELNPLGTIKVSGLNDAVGVQVVGDKQVIAVQS